MDYKFLDKVLDQIISETKLVYEGGTLWYVFPFSPEQWVLRYYVKGNGNDIRIDEVDLIDLNFELGNEFDKHCRDIYGLSNDEIDYVYKEYTRNLREKKWIRNY